MGMVWDCWMLLAMLLSDVPDCKPEQTSSPMVTSPASLELELVPSPRPYVAIMSAMNFCCAAV
jgi:hypothetical protein